jgi:hypothetical protein
MSLSAGFVGAGPSPIFEGVALWNGVGWDQQMNNQSGILLASAARTSSAVAPVQTNYNARGLVLFLNVTAASGSSGLIVQLLGIDPVSGSAVQFPTKNGTRVAATGSLLYVWYPGIAEVAAQANSLMSASSMAVPRTWEAIVNAGDATSYTYSLGYSYIV